MSRPGELESATEPTHVAGKRKLERACDQCRKRRTRCDGGGSVENGRAVIHRVCTTCTGLGISCTYMQASTRRGPPPGYIEALEFKVKRLSNHLSTTCSANQLVQVAGPAISQQTFAQETFAKQLRDAGVSQLPTLKRKRAVKEEAGNKSGPALSSPHKEAIYNFDSSAKDAPLSSEFFIEDDSADDRDLSSRFGIETRQANPSQREATEAVMMRGRTMNGSLENPRFIGRNANFSLLRAAYRSRHRIFNPGSSGQDLPGLPKPSVWCDKPWEIDALSPSVEMPIDYSQWPDEDLAEKLIKAYFDWDNLLLPLLNRVHFKRDYYALRWRDDREFARLCLCVFAIASPRITGSDRNSVQDGENSAIEQHSAGWHWIKSVMRTSAATLKPATLVSLQVQTLVGNFLGSRRTVLDQWSVVGSALRSCIDIGLHKQAGMIRFRDQQTIEYYKRVAWCLIYLDRQASTLLGRPLVIPLQSFDLELPIDVDDEYWDTGHAEMNFQQPRGRPSKLSFFLLALDIQFLGMTANHVEIRDRLDAEAMCKLVVDFNLAAATSLQRIPPHLSFDSEHDIHWMMVQSGTLASQFYQCQIMANRPVTNVDNIRFLEQRRAASAACDLAAKATCHIVRRMQRKNYLHQDLCSSIMSACIIRLHSSFSPGLEGSSALHASEALDDVQICLNALSELESRWIRASRFKSILLDLLDSSSRSVELPQEPDSSGRGPSNQTHTASLKPSHGAQLFGATLESVNTTPVERGISDGHVDRPETRVVYDGHHTVLPAPLGLMEDMWAMPSNNFDWEEWALYLSLGVLEEGRDG